MTTSNQACAAAFVQGQPARTANAQTDGRAYRLFRSCIAWRDDAGNITGTYAGWVTRTTYNHLVNIAQAAGGPMPPHPIQADPAATFPLSAQ